MPTHTVTTVDSGGLTRTGDITAATRAAACKQAISDHRDRRIELALSSSASLQFARTTSILVSTVEVITFAAPQIGDTITPKDAA